MKPAVLAPPPPPEPFHLEPVAAGTPLVLRPVRNGGWIVELEGEPFSVRRAQGAFTTTDEMLAALGQALR